MRQSLRWQFSSCSKQQGTTFLAGCPCGQKKYSASSAPRGISLKCRCEKSYKNQTALAVHKNSIYSSAKCKPKEVYPCNECGSKLTGYVSLVSHKNAHARIWWCELCGSTEMRLSKNTRRPVATGSSTLRTIQQPFLQA